MNQFSLFPICVFVDLGHLVSVAKKHGIKYPSPAEVMNLVFGSSRALPSILRREPHPRFRTPGSPLSYRVRIYDAEGSEVDSDRRRYWKALAVEQNTSLSFGRLRPATKKRPREQKQVDVRIAVDMLAGALTKQFQAAYLVSADSDFVPLLDEVRRAGVLVGVIGDQSSAMELYAGADQCFDLSEVLRMPGHKGYADEQISKLYVEE